jgi:hypothetical protein
MKSDVGLSFTETYIVMVIHAYIHPIHVFGKLIFWNINSKYSNWLNRAPFPSLSQSITSLTTTTPSTNRLLERNIVCLFDITHQTFANTLYIHIVYQTNWSIL